MLIRRAATAVLIAVATVLAGCSSTGAAAPSTPPPTAAELVGRVQTAMGEVTDAAFDIAVTGSLDRIVVQKASGALTKTGDAQGTATVTQLGQLLEVSFVFVGEDLYLKAATGGYSKIPSALAGQLYDPTTILSTDTGVSNVIAKATALTAPTASGATFTTTGTVPQAVAAALAPGINADVTGVFVVDAASSRLNSVSFEMTGDDGAPATVTLTLRDYNTGVKISAPA